VDWDISYTPVLVASLSTSQKWLCDNNQPIISIRLVGPIISMIHSTTRYTNKMSIVYGVYSNKYILLPTWHAVVVPLLKPGRNSHARQHIFFNACDVSLLKVKTCGLCLLRWHWLSSMVLIRGKIKAAVCAIFASAAITDRFTTWPEAFGIILIWPPRKWRRLRPLYTVLRFSYSWAMSLEQRSDGDKNQFAQNCCRDHHHLVSLNFRPG